MSPVAISALQDCGVDAAVAASAGAARGERTPHSIRLTPLSQRYKDSQAYCFHRLLSKCVPFDCTKHRSRSSLQDRKESRLELQKLVNSTSNTRTYQHGGSTAWSAFTVLVVSGRLRPVCGQQVQLCTVVPGSVGPCLKYCTQTCVPCTWSTCTIRLKF